MASEHVSDPAAARNLTGGLLLVLLVVTIAEGLAVSGALALPSPVLLVLAAVQVTLCIGLVVRLLSPVGGDPRLVPIPVLLLLVAPGALLALSNQFRADYPRPGRAADSALVSARYSGAWSGECNTWIQSPFSGAVYCSSPALGWSNQSAYDAFAPKPVTADPDFAGFDQKSADEKQALLMKKGAEVYATNCQACHQADGVGTPGVFPPLANDPVANGGSVDEHIGVILKGLQGKEINGVVYSGAMTPWAQLTDDQIASVVTYERNSWGNAGGMVEPTQVAALRGK